MNRSLTTLAFSLIALCATTHVRAQSEAPMLASPDARVIGMGGVSMTVLSDSHAIYDNAAMAVFAPAQWQLSSSYQGLHETDYYSVTGFYRLDMNNLIQGGWRQYLREKGDGDMAVDLGYSRRLGEQWAIGIVGRYVHLKRPDGAADAIAADVSAAWSHPVENIGSYATVRAGAKLSNLGGFLKNTPYKLPIKLTVGATLDTFVSDAHEVTVGADLGYNFSPAHVRGFEASIGAEYNLMQLFQFRAGYHFGEEAAFYPSYTSVGVGVRILHLRLDFAYLFAAKTTLLHNTYSLSFGLDF